MAEDTARTGNTETTTEHETIRNWIEERGSTAAEVTEPAGDDPGSLAVIPEGTMDDSVRGVSWEEFFKIFDEEELAFVHQIDKEDPDEQWFCAFVEREEAGTVSSEGRTTESEDRETLDEVEQEGTGEAVAGSGVGASSEAGSTEAESAEEVGDLDEPAKLDEEQPEETGTDEPTSPMEEVHEDRTDESDAERIGHEGVEGEPGMREDELGEAETVENEPVEGRMGESGPISEDMPEAEPASDEMTESEEIDGVNREDEAMVTAEVDEDEIVAGEMTSRGEGSEDGIGEQTFEENEEMRTENDVATEELGERSGEPDAGGRGESEPAEPLESEVEPTDTTEREPLESEVSTEEREPMETPTDEQGVDTESMGSDPVGSGAEPAEPGEPTPDEEFPAEREPPESEPAEPTETDMRGEPIESGSMEGEGEIGGDPIGSESETVEGEPGFDETTAGAAGAGTGMVDLTADEEGKDVVNADGEHLGTVEDIEGDAIHVDLDPEMTDDRRSEFGWGDRENEIHRVENDRIREVTVTEVVIFRL